MDLLLWKEELITDPATAAERAAAGAAWLDRTRGPGWDRLLDLDRLDIAHPFNCVLGQLNAAGYFLIPSPRRGVDCGFSCGVVMDLLLISFRPAAVVRSYELLTDAWKALLRERRAPAPRADVRRDAAAGPAPAGEPAVAA